MNEGYDGDGNVCWDSSNGGADVCDNVRSYGDGGGSGRVSTCSKCIGVSGNIRSHGALF